MTRERYERFLRSPLGRWLEAQLPGSPTQPASAAVGRFVALLAADDALELLDLVMYRLYGFSPADVEIAEHYLRNGGADRAVAESLDVRGYPELWPGPQPLAEPDSAEYNGCPTGS